MLALAATICLVAAATATAAGSATRVAATQELAALSTPHPARVQPSAASSLIEIVPARRPITDERTVLPVIGHAIDAAGSRWLHVRLPGRPNGHTGWIAKRATISGVTPWHIVVHTLTRRVSAYRDGRMRRTFRAVVGKPSTPTPRGEYFVEEAVQLTARDAGGPFALALSARSDVLQEFDGGPGQIALHGLDNVGGVLGTAASHGCIRLDDRAIGWLVTWVGAGVPVTIER